MVNSPPNSCSGFDHGSVEGPRCPSEGEWGVLGDVVMRQRSQRADRGNLQEGVQKARP